jgi:hypothetical protein
MPDPARMCKLTQNVFGEKRKLLNKLQEQERLYLANELRKRHVLFFKQKINVKLATQLLSKSVANSLFFCKRILKLQQFANCKPTADFILLINDAFDILNVRNLKEYGSKIPISGKNINAIISFEEKCIHYIKK